MADVFRFPDPSPRPPPKNILRATLSASWPQRTPI